MRRLLLLAGLLIYSIPVEAQDKSQLAYCSYTTEQAEAQATVLQHPNAVAGITQPNTGTTPQMYSGLTQSITDWRKASLTRRAALADCTLYTATDDANLKIQNALPSLQKAALLQRIIQIQAAITRLDTMINRMLPIIEAQNATLPQLYVLQTARAKLELDKTNAALQAAQIELTDTPEVSLQSILSKKWTAELAKQTADSKLARADNWDLLLEGGLHQQIHPFIAGKPGFYGTVIFQYNLGSKKRNRALEASSRDFQVWKAEQKNDVIQQATLLQRSVIASLVANKKQLIDLLTTYEGIERKLEITDQVDSKESISFSTQLLVDQIATKVEIGNTEFRIAQLQQYLQDNF